MVLSSRKKFASFTALLLTATLLFGGTFAWQSISQEALNEIRGGINPGGRLHDDFTVVYAVDDSARAATRKTYNKDVYVENFTNIDEGVEIYVRVRLDEYMEIGAGAGTTSEGKTAQSVISGARFTDTSTWKTFIPGEDNDIRDYWSWDTTGGKTTYMPTFNKNKDSLAADINGTSTTGFTDYVDYSLEKNQSKTAYAIYDNDENDADEVGKNVTDIITRGEESVYYNESNIRLAQETHVAEETINGDVILMEEWLRLEDDEKSGNFWVWDEDGWAYWAKPISPGTATGLLLDEVRRTNVTIEDEDHNETSEWYYGINVVAQLITADDIGSDEYGTGFYDSTKFTETAKEPTANALALLSAIGVITDGSTAAAPLMLQRPNAFEVTDEDELIKAVKNGGDITLADDISLSRPITVDKETVIYLDGYDIYPSSRFSGDALFVVKNGQWLDFNDEGRLDAPSNGYVVWIKDNSMVYIWDGSYAAGEGIIYVEEGDAAILDGEFEGNLVDWDEESYDDGMVGVTVYGGTFFGSDPSNINGKNLLLTGYAVEEENIDGKTAYVVVYDDSEEELPEEELPKEELPEDGEENGEIDNTGEEMPKDDVPKEDVPKEETPETETPKEDKPAEEPKNETPTENESEKNDSKPDENKPSSETETTPPKDTPKADSTTPKNDSSNGTSDVSGISGKAEAEETPTETTPETGE